MIYSKIFAIWIAFMMLIFAVWQRKRILDLTCTGVFFISYFIFVLLGLLIAPWLISSYFAKSVSFLRLYLISDRDLCLAILAIAAGLWLVFLGHVFADAFLLVGTGERKNKRQWGYLLRKTNTISLGTNPLRLRCFFTFALGLALVLLMPKLHVAINGIKRVYFGEQVTTYYDYRVQIAKIGYIYFILVFNILPFLSIGLWMLYRFKISHKNRLWAFVSMGVTSLLLLLLFQKRPLILYLLTLIMTHGLCEIYTGRWHIGSSYHSLSLSYLLFRIPWRKVVFSLFIPFLILIWFFKVSTNIASFWGLIIIALDRTLSRLAIAPIMYIHYFPNIEPYYGLKNIGLLTRFWGLTPYRDTIQVMSYFSYNYSGKGGAAIGSIVDFYCAFGWWYLVLACFGLGIFLNLLDRWLSSLPFTITNRMLYIFMIIFAYYLSQASVARSLSGYGGGYFFILWFFLKLKLKSPRRLANNMA